MKKDLFVKIILVIIGLLLLANLFSDLLPLKVYAKAINKYKIERVVTAKDPGSEGQLWIKMNEIMKTYTTGSIISVVHYSSDEKESIWYLFVKVY